MLQCIHIVFASSTSIPIAYPESNSDTFYSSNDGCADFTSHIAAVEAAYCTSYDSTHCRSIVESNHFSNFQALSTANNSTYHCFANNSIPDSDAFFSSNDGCANLTSNTLAHIAAVEAANYISYDSTHCRSIVEPNHCSDFQAIFAANSTGAPTTQPTTAEVSS